MTEGINMRREIIISPSLLCADFAHLEDEVRALEAAGCEWLHFDCMDGHFTDQVTYGHIVAQALRDLTDRFFDCHLMFTNPEKHLEFFAEAGADGISVHYEVTDDPAGLLERIRRLGCKANLAVNPDTPIAKVEPLLEHCDIVMIMGVFPGYAGQSFIPESTQRITELRRMIDAGGYETLIEFDGGLNAETAEGVIAAGADVLVSGSFLFKRPGGYAGAVEFLRDVAAAVG